MMENTYGIGVANRYALFLDDESDPLETLSLKEQEKDLKKKSKIIEKETKPKSEPIKPKPIINNQKKTNKENKVQIENKREDNKNNQQRPPTEAKVERNFNKSNNENREERNNRRNRDDRPFNGPSENRENSYRDREDRPRRENAVGTGGDQAFENRRERGTGDRGERGERGGNRPLNNRALGPRGPKRFENDRRGKREFDRQSGSDKTGVKPVDKREGAGAHNWGSHKDVIEEADKSNNDPDQIWNEADKPENTTTPENKEEENVENTVEEEPKELTLDEWKAQRAGRAKPQYNIRKAGEGEDPSQWKKMYELRKKENESESEDEEYDAAEYPQRVGRQKHILEIDIQFNDNRRGPPRGARGQRAGPRPNRPPNQRQGGNGNGPNGIAGSGSGGNTTSPGANVGQNGTGNGTGQSERADRTGREGTVTGNIHGTERPERRYRDEQADEKNENKRAPKVDDERDFPSLG